MNKKSPAAHMKGVICALLVLTITLTSASKPANVYASPTARIYLVPSNYFFDATNGTIGTLFNVTVMVEDVSDLISYQITMFYNDTIINVTRWYEPTGDPTYVFYGRTTLPVPPPPPVSYYHTGPNNGSATVGSALFPFPGQTPFAGNGKLCIIQFNITAFPLEGTYTSGLDIFSLDTFLLNSVGDEIPGVTKENGYYTIVPEFNILLILLIFMVATIVAIAITRKLLPKSKSITIK